MSELALFIQKAILEQRKLLAIYLTTSFPRAEWTVPLGQAILQAGADLIELGFPFSDPLADGPTIQHASTIALSAGFKRQQIFTAASVLSKAAPVLIMGYLNSVLSAGNEQFLADCKASGVSGLIVPDLPIDENEELWNNGERDGVPLMAVQSSNEFNGLHPCRMPFQVLALLWQNCVALSIMYRNKR
jgi:tryptophan synthase alpha chain